MKRVWVAAAASALIFLLAGGGLFLTFRQPKVTSATTRTWATATPSPSSSTSASPSPSSSTDQIHGVQATLPSCSAGALYSVSPIEPDKLSYILPLGNFTPLPSDHLYFVITRGAANGTNAPTETVKLFAPGDITVFRIGRQVQTTNGKIVNTDYYMNFAPCREVSGAFGHVSSLAGRLAGIDFDNCETPYSIGNGSLYEHCAAEVNIEVRAGEQLGTAGGKSSAALDFSSDDWRVPAPYVANPDHHYDLQASCALKYYEGSLKTSLQLLLGRGGDGRHLAQGCGEVFQDKQGTLQGNWFNGTPAQTSNDIRKLLALAHENVDPRIAVISIGGTITQRGEWRFDPTHSGTLNREFSEVTPGDAIYCYQASGMPGRILIELISETNLKIEHQSGSCTASVAFAQPFDYQR